MVRGGRRSLRTFLGRKRLQFRELFRQLTPCLGVELGNPSGGISKEVIRDNCRSKETGNSLLLSLLDWREVHIRMERVAGAQEVEVLLDGRDLLCHFGQRDDRD